MRSNPDSAVFYNSDFQVIEVNPAFTNLVVAGLVPKIGLVFLNKIVEFSYKPLSRILSGISSFSTTVYVMPSVSPS